jgi:hypothetical protein
MDHEQSPDIKSETHGPSLAEQRRPGRGEYRSPELIRLLRRDGGSPIPPSAEGSAFDHEKSQLEPFTGIMVSVGLSLLIWFTVSALFYYVI